MRWARGVAGGPILPGPRTRRTQKRRTDQPTGGLSASTVALATIERRRHKVSREGTHQPLSTSPPSRRRSIGRLAWPPTRASRRHVLPRAVERNSRTTTSPFHAVSEGWSAWRPDRPTGTARDEGRQASRRALEPLGGARSGREIDPHGACQGRDREMAGAEGFEPSVADPKSAALPLGHAPGP